MKVSRPVAVLARTSALALALGLALPSATAAAEPLAGRPVPPLGTWTGSCGSGFRLSSMPSAWHVSPGEPVRVFTRLAVDFDALPEDAYAVEVSADGEKSHQLLGFGSGLLHAVVREAETDRLVAVLAGSRLAAAGSAPAVHTWNGRDQQGRPVSPGVYEIEVRARMVPAWAEPWMREDAAYADLEGWAEAAEACSRALRVEVVEGVEGARAALGFAPLATSCATVPASYYASVDASTPAALRATLHQVIDDHVRFPYTSSSTDTWDILNDADENPANPSTVLDLYKNTTYPDGCSTGCAWNREHTWAKSFGFQTESGSAATPYTDAHHLRATDPGYNSSRSNLPHGECVSGCTEYPTEVNAGFGGSGQPNRGTGGSISCTTPTPGQVWEVWDHRKGDVARSILYMDLRYEGGTGPLGAEPDLIASDDLSLMYAETTSCGDGYMPVAYHGMLSTLLAWHAADPPDADEIRRNDQVWCYQQNRNPFVDHPEWVDCIYLGSCGGGGALAFGGIVSAVDAVACSASGVAVTWAAPSAWNDDCTSGCSRGFRVLRNGIALASGGCAAPLASTATSCTDGTAVAGTTYTYAVEAFNHQAETSTGGTTATAADRTNDGVAPVITAGPTVAATTTTSLTVTWTTDEPSDGRVEYGLTTAYGSVVSNATLATSHSLTVTGLAAGTTYHFRAGSTDACGTGPRYSADLTATTQTSGGGGTPLAVGGYRLTQANATYVYTLPAGTTVPANGYLVVARSADKAAFEAFWGVTLGADAAFLNSAGGMPVINGSETYTLADAGGTIIDGPTIAMGSSGAQSLRRIDPCQAAGLSSSWAIGTESAATVGSGAGAGCGVGLVINEFSDASGSGNYVYEFLELHYDSAAPADTTAPAASITSPASGATVSGTVAVTATATDAVGVTKVEFLLDGALQATDTTSPYSWSWATTAAANGSHSLVAKAYDAAGNVGTSASVTVAVSNDTTAPVASITFPANGATVSGTVAVAASATDAFGVTKVEFFLDGALQATDTASPYSWSWATTAAANGSHSLVAKAYDAAGNVGTSATVTVTVSNVTGTSVGGWKIVQASSTLTYTIPAGTVIPANGYLVVGRNATKAAFETFWKTTLGTNVVYLSGGDLFPQINGSESFTLYNASGAKVDGKTVSMPSTAAKSYQRKDPCLAAGKTTSWTIGSDSNGTPGRGAGTGCAAGVRINEFSDASGAGNYIFEFVELHSDN
jgi:endonuclease I